jgi:hypothetical protein
MNAVLSEPDRERIQRINCALRDANRAASSAESWRRKVVAVLSAGPATRADILLELCGTSASATQRSAIVRAIRVLLDTSVARERPMFEFEGRATRVDPVLVLELVA